MRQGFRPFCLTMRRTGLVGRAKSQRVAPASPEMDPARIECPGLAESKSRAASWANDGTVAHRAHFAFASAGGGVWALGVLSVLRALVW
jgi:hypothetical protein